VTRWCYPLSDVTSSRRAAVTAQVEALDNAGDWIRAGAVAVGIGSALLDASAVADGRFDVITANARRVVGNVAAARR
jgi:2-keto-3-deoxy-6-phosphogluconate aldolase